VTVPLTHLPLIFISVFICQIIHEAGHAISAALQVPPPSLFYRTPKLNFISSEQIPLLTTGLSLTLIIPSAFVTFPSPLNTPGDTQKQQSLARMRLVAAGAWHNLVFWGLLLFFAWVCQGWIWGWGFEDMSGEGKVVLGFDEVSWTAVLSFFLKLTRLLL
jgi:S2P endopeptidase